ncbi:uncharacterized protein N7469_002949 [Penicillium citrinum]|uniref:Uncharacterized protein n=2 Tax=Penicillium TaxID=5073 RepID=A0A9W9TUR4_PENCI|nr:uncharacterized protein N7469_002949 [Penicillium citrinum]KAJ5241358.1 hypothetical protein N7469_002949 [Penicillium citrinum]KAJ5586364.1 hypothetical protein N7450_006151 [Penicillium hetheringtonii]
MDSRGIEPRTTPMLREYYTTKPQAHLLKDDSSFGYMNPDLLFVCGSAFRLVARLKVLRNATPTDAIAMV